VYGTAGDDLPVPPPRCTERLLQPACDAAGLPCVPAPGSILTRPRGSRPACHYCGQCYRGCKIGACYSSSLVHIFPAIETGRLTLTTNAMAREILVDADGLARSVSYIDKVTNQERQVRARVVVLAASACESARLLLNSRSSRYPAGLANGSGQVGRNLRDSVSSMGLAYFPQLERVPPHNHDGVGRPHVWVPKGKLPGADAPKNFHIFFVGGRNVPTAWDFDWLLDARGGYGASLKSACKQTYGSTVRFVAAGEMIANDRSYCDVSDTDVDDFGIPVLRFHFKWGAPELALAKAMQDSIGAIVERAGGTYLTDVTATGALPHGISVGGASYHEQGTVRMGEDPRTSVLNGFCQAHDVPNMFVIDAATFVTSSDKPPTLTIMALAWRACEFLVEQLRTGDL
jgi:choline dehydrogenase-like flavoprotein